MSSVCRRFKIIYVENTAGVFRYFIWKKETENTVEIVHRLVDDLVVFTLDTLEKKS